MKVLLREEAVVAKFKVLSQCLSGGTEENTKILRIVSLRAEIWTKVLPNIKQDHSTSGPRLSV
jgi:hypothetical protein